MKNILLPFKSLRYLSLLLLVLFSSCQEEQVNEEISSSAPLKDTETFVFTYKNQEYIEQLVYSPSSPLDVPLPKNEVLSRAMQQPDAAVFINTEEKKVGIFDSVEEAKRALGISDVDQQAVKEETENARSINRKGIVTVFDHPSFDCQNRCQRLEVRQGGPPPFNPSRIADLSSLSRNGETFSLDRAVSSIQMGNLHESKWLIVLLYEATNYYGKALILQCPPDYSRPPVDYNASFRYFNFVRADGEPLVWAPVYTKPGYFNRRYRDCDQAYIDTYNGDSRSNFIVNWNDRVRSLELFFTDKHLSLGDCIPPL